jgi:hypothetical protein
VADQPSFPHKKKRKKNWRSESKFFKTEINISFCYLPITMAFLFSNWPKNRAFLLFIRQWNSFFPEIEQSNEQIWAVSYFPLHTKLNNLILIEFIPDRRYSEQDNPALCQREEKLCHKCRHQFLPSLSSLFNYFPFVRSRN